MGETLLNASLASPCLSTGNLDSLGIFDNLSSSPKRQLSVRFGMLWFCLLGEAEDKQRASCAQSEALDRMGVKVRIAVGSEELQVSSGFL